MSNNEIKNELLLIQNDEDETFKDTSPKEIEIETQNPKSEHEDSFLTKYIERFEKHLPEYNHSSTLNNFININPSINPKSKSSLQTQRETPLIKAPPEFLEMMNSDLPKRKHSHSSNIALSLKIPEKVSILNHEEIKILADNFLNGKKKEIKDPATIADLINELTNRRIETMKKCNYKESQKIGIIINELRQSYRERDRTTFHKETINELKEKLKESQNYLIEIEKNWKFKINKKKEIQKEELKELEIKLNKEHELLENDWKNPITARKFSKRSSNLLQKQTAEKHLALVGDFEAAANLRKEIQKLENIEINEKYLEMKNSFNKEKEKLNQKQQQKIQLLKESQNRDLLILEKRFLEEIESIKKRIKAIENELIEESSFNNFCAKKFKKSSDIIVPMTVTLNGGVDLPTAGKLRVTNRNTGKIMEYRESSIFTPLPLPTLKFKKKNKIKIKKELN